MNLVSQEVVYGGKSIKSNGCKRVIMMLGASTKWQMEESRTNEISRL